MSKPPTTGLESSGIIRGGRALSIFLCHVPHAASSVCDLGCGSGEFLRQLAKRGYTRLSGVELNDYGTKEFDVTSSDLSREPLPFAAGTLDAVTAWEVFEHLENPYHLIRETLRVLKPGGLLLLSMPNIFHIRNRLRFLRRGDFIRWNKKNDHRTYFTNKVFQKSFLRGFGLVERRFCVPSLTQTPVKKYDRAMGVRWKIIEKGKIFSNGFLPESEWFGYFVVYVLKKKVNVAGA